MVSFLESFYAVGQRLAATGQDLGAYAVGALFDDELNQLLDVDGTKDSAIYMAAIGHPR